MKTTIDIPENELRDAMRFTRATTKREAVVKILEEFNRRRRMAELVKYSGTFSDRFPTNDEIEAIDAKRDRVNALLESGEAAWCPVVRLELGRGVTSDAERKTLRRYEALLPDYEISAEVWNQSVQLADRGRASGMTVPLADLLIFACARIHSLDIAHDDTHFDELAKLEA